MSLLLSLLTTAIHCITIVVTIGLLNNLVGLLLIVSTIPSYILILTPVREHVEVLLLNYWHRIIQYDATSFLEDVGKNIIRSALVLGTSVIAIQDPNFGSTLGAVGGLTDAFQAFIVPIIIFFYLSKIIIH